MPIPKPFSLQRGPRRKPRPSKPAYDISTPSAGGAFTFLVQVIGLWHRVPPPLCENDELVPQPPVNVDGATILTQAYRWGYGVVRLAGDEDLPGSAVATLDEDACLSTGHRAWNCQALSVVFVSSQMQGTALDEEHGPATRYVAWSIRYGFSDATDDLAALASFAPDDEGVTARAMPLWPYRTGWSDTDEQAFLYIQDDEYLQRPFSLYALRPGFLTDDDLSIAAGVFGLDEDSRTATALTAWLLYAGFIDRSEEFASSPLGLDDEILIGKILQHWILRQGFIDPSEEYGSVQFALDDEIVLSKALRAWLLQGGFVDQSEEFGSVQFGLDDDAMVGVRLRLWNLVQGFSQDYEFSLPLFGLDEEGLTAKQVRSWILSAGFRDDEIIGYAPIFEDEGQYGHAVRYRAWALVQGFQDEADLGGAQTEQSPYLILFGAKRSDSFDGQQREQTFTGSHDASFEGVVRIVKFKGTIRRFNMGKS